MIERYLEVRSADGSVLYRNERLGGRALGGLPFPEEGVGGYSERSERLSDGTRVRVVSRVHSLDGHPLLIHLAHSAEPLYSRLRDLFLASLVVLPVMLLIARLAGYGLARRALSPIEKMARRAQQITPEKLHARLPVNDTDDELGQLAKVFTETRARLEQAFEQLRRFTSDASHELRTPLAMIRSVGEVGLQKDGSRAEYRDIIGSMLDEVNRLTSLIDNLLTIWRADSGHIQLHWTAVQTMALAREAAALFEILTEEKSQRLEIEGDESAQVEGDPIFLRQALVNVIHNAVKYSPVGETISVRVRNDDGYRVVIDIKDNGPGIPLEDQPKVFDRFYRVDKARWRESGGAGLGLSIAKWAVEAHGGTVTLESEINKGCIFRIILPRADGPSNGAPPGDSSTDARTCMTSATHFRIGPKLRDTFKAGFTWTILAALLGSMYADTADKLFEAVRSGDLRRIRAALSKGADVSAPDTSGQTALMLAAGMGRADVARLLLDRRAPVEAKDQNGATALMVATTTGHVSVIRELLKRGADINAANNAGMTPVLAAIMSDRFDVAEQLISAGAKVNIATANGTTPLIAAIVEGRTNVVALLLRHGADPNLRDNNGLTPLISAVARNRFEIVKLLVADGADVDATDPQGLTPLRIATLQHYENVANLLKQHNAR